MAKILVVEDDEQLRQNISEQLELNNHEVKVAWNGVQALEILPTFLPALILCDIIMPEMDGIAFIQTVKRQAEYRSIPFIFLTAKVAQQDLIRGLEEGAVDYLSKPFLHRELLLKVNNITGQQRDMVLHQLQKTIASEKTDFQFARLFTEALDRRFEDSSLTIEIVAEEMNMSLSALQRNVKKQFSRNFSDLLKEYRLQKAVNYLSQTDHNLQWIASRCGFSSLSYFSYCFKKLHLLSPLQFRTKFRLSHE